MSHASRIVVVGATGYTGRLVVRELAAQGLPFLPTGRHAGKLEKLAEETGCGPGAVVDVLEPGSLDRVLAPGDVVANCAGPFTDLGEPVVRAAVQACAHYLDTTGEQRFMHAIHQRYDAVAHSAGVAVVNAMAFEYALGDAAAAVAAARLTPPLRSVDVVYAWREAAASRGTRRTALRIAESRGYTYEHGGWRLEPPAAHRRSVQVGGRRRSAVSFPAGEVVTVPLHVAVERVRGWMVVGRRTARWAPLVAPAIPLLARLADPVVERLLGRGPEGPTPEERTASRFTIRVEAEDAAGERLHVTVEGNDPYGLTAAILVTGARRLLEGEPERTGVIAPSQLLRPERILDGLEARGVEWEVSGPADRD